MIKKRMDTNFIYGNEVIMILFEKFMMKFHIYWFIERLIYNCLFNKKYTILSLCFKLLTIFVSKIAKNIKLIIYFDQLVNIKKLN